MVLSSRPVRAAEAGTPRARTGMLQGVNKGVNK